MEQTPLVDLDNDKQLVRTLFNNFESLLVFVFYSEASEEAKRYLQKLTRLVKTFAVERVRWFSMAAERCPEIFKQFGV